MGVVSQRVKVGDILLEINGKRCPPDEMAQLLRSEGLITIVFGRLDDPAACQPKSEVPKDLDDDRYKKLLVYFNQVLLSRGHTALAYFQSIDLDRDGRISSAEFRKAPRDVGVTDVDSKEILL